MHVIICMIEIPPSPIPAFRRMFFSLLPQITGLVLAGLVFFLGRMLGEHLLAEKLGLRFPAVALYLLLLSAAVYAGIRLVWKTETKVDRYMPIFEFALFLLPFLFVFIYILFYAFSLY
jgi:hypothetical protein